MSDIERRFFECPEHGKTPVSARDTAIVPDCCPEREAVEVVYVPRDIYQGAVNRLAEIKRAVDAWEDDEVFLDDHDPLESDADFLRYIDRVIGGQSAASPRKGASDA